MNEVTNFLDEAKARIKAEFEKLEVDLKNLLPTEHHDAVSSQVSTASAAIAAHVENIPLSMPAPVDASKQAQSIPPSGAVDAEGNPAGVKRPGA